MIDKRKAITDLRKETGMNRKEFCEYFQIPYRTMQSWELGERELPDYLLRLLAYRVKLDPLLKKGEEKAYQDFIEKAEKEKRVS